MAYRKHPDNHPASGIFCLPSAVQKEEPDRKNADSGFGITKLIKPLTFFWILTDVFLPQRYLKPREKTVIKK